jgi:hypothetical protein
MYPYIQVGDKVARLFQSHELKGGLPEQWINGKVSGTKFNPKKGQRMQQPTWWSVTFDPPASTLLCCNSEEVEQMRQQWEALRVKKATLQEHVGQELRVEWTDEDSDPSFSDWDGDLRVCVITKYLAAQEQFVLRLSVAMRKWSRPTHWSSWLRTVKVIWHRRNIKLKRVWQLRTKNGRNISHD